MIVPKDISVLYENRKEYFAALKDTISNFILPFCEKHGFAYQSRIKEMQSLVEKIHTGRFAILSDIDDIVAASIIIPNLNHLEPTIDFLIENFMQVELKKRGQSLKAPDRFVYDSTRFIGRLKQNVQSKEHKGYSIYSQLFEVQIRTAFEYACSTATHNLTYKSDILSWERLRLTAQIKATVEQLDMLISSFDEVNHHIVKSVWPELEIKRKIAEYFNDKFERNRIPSELRPKSISRFSENIVEFLKKSSRVNEKDHRKTARDMKKILDEIFEKFEGIEFPRSLTLTQTIIGEVVQEEAYEYSETKYVFFVTDEQKDLYPKVAEIDNFFLID